MTLVVVYGPPAAGKTTYIAQRRAPHDIVIDFDALAVALGSPDSHDHTGHIRQLANTVRAAAIRKAAELDADTWVIDTWLKTAALRDMPAEYTLIDPGLTVALRRAKQDGRPAASIATIERWYTNPPQPPHDAITPAATPTNLGTGVADWW